ncbi:two-component system alkaline phosphatase synthesis response regulator PhoP [Dyadobacter jejuensis]|uniref:Phosphate regulon transcriptional regulatory protein PhoB n=1 Tax=Dyadobacter jejuensis TaxID=1082580 RepID=A0A316AFK1_9BACT|nr:response regulator transcription factor [Dyadobacter jejuensis]PWJ56523.1 two-component system alkaline phosphatase synthesis response regulator PhoP [Dyadobacter jejuensis]
MSTAKANTTAPKVLVVDDDSDIVELLEYNLEKEGYTVETASNGKQAIEITKTYIPDLILLDIMMPQMDGIETGRILRQNLELKNTYILFLTARSEEYSEVAAFEVGADDYITKPIKPRALMSRINALFRREAQKAESGDQIDVLDLSINRKNYTVTQGQANAIVLPKKEFELLFFLAQTPNKVFSRDELLQKIWGADIYVLERTVDVHIRKLREKLGESYIKTLKGVGYMFATQNINS